MVVSIEVEPTSIESERSAQLFAALADPARLRILAVLADAARCVCDIRTAIPIAANLLSYHLRVLRQVGLIEGARRGRWIDYRLCDNAAEMIAAAVAAGGFSAAIEQPAGCSQACAVPT
jgi:ArsR family transcriptional regulator